jgi:hypothetical protein
MNGVRSLLSLLAGQSSLIGKYVLKVSPLNLKRVTDYGASRIVHERPDYQLFTNNCQSFTQHFATAIIDNPLLPDSLETPVKRWARLFKLRSHKAPATSSGTFDLPIPEEGFDETYSESIGWDGNILGLIQTITNEKRSSKLHKHSIPWNIS